MAWWRLKSDLRNLNDNAVGYKFLKQAFVAYLLLWFVGLSYGAWRINDINRNDSLHNSDSFLNVIAIQPNFPSKIWLQNQNLLIQNDRVIWNVCLRIRRNTYQNFRTQSIEPTLLVWPESVFPHPFFKVKEARQKVTRFAKENNTSILFTTVDWENTITDRKFHGVSVLVGSNGKILGRYNKIFLIPFGEMIPFSKIFPKTASWLRTNIANMSEFEPGQEYKVFSLSEKSGSLPQFVLMFSLRRLFVECLSMEQILL